jgi:hypothetical protein
MSSGPLRPKAAGRHADGIYLHHESNGNGGPEDPRWEPVGPDSWTATREQAYSMMAPPPPPRWGYDRAALTIGQIFAMPAHYAMASGDRVSGQDGGFTSTSTPANNWW